MLNWFIYKYILFDKKLTILFDLIFKSYFFDN